MGIPVYLMLAYSSRDQRAMAQGGALRHRTRRNENASR
jgi:hypothetical protein